MWDWFSSPINSLTGSYRLKIAHHSANAETKNSDWLCLDWGSGMWAFRVLLKAWACRIKNQLSQRKCEEGWVHDES